MSHGSDSAFARFARFIIALCASPLAIGGVGACTATEEVRNDAALAIVVGTVTSAVSVESVAITAERWVSGAAAETIDVILTENSGQFRGALTNLKPGRWKLEASASAVLTITGTDGLPAQRTFNYFGAAAGSDGKGIEVSPGSAPSVTLHLRDIGGQNHDFENIAPRITSLSISNASPVAGTTIDLVATSTDADATHPLSFAWSVTNPANVTSPITTGVTTACVGSPVGCTSSLSWLAPSAAGDYRSTAKSSEGGAIASAAAAITAVVRVAPSGPPCVAPPAGLAAWWRAEDNGIDVGGRTATTTNGAPISFRDGQVGRAFSFSGGTELRASASGLPLGNAPRTLEAWVSLDPQSGTDHIVVGYGVPDLTRAFLLGTRGNQVFFSQWGGAVFGPAATLAVWTHLAATYTSPIATLYVNGNAVGSAALPVDTAGGAALIGGIDGLPTYRLNGGVDEATIYTRALNAAEIRSLYEAGRAGKCR